MDLKKLDANWQLKKTNNIILKHAHQSLNYQCNSNRKEKIDIGEKKQNTLLQIKNFIGLYNGSSKELGITVRFYH